MKFRVIATHVWARDVRWKLVRNPAYCGNHVAFHNWCFMPLNPRSRAGQRKPLFFEALRESIQREGFRNPIVVYNFPEGLMLSFGGSRLRVAQELDLMIPVIMVDFVGDYEGPTVTQDNYDEFFTDVPKHFVIDADGVDTHYSLERNRRHEYDEAGMAWAEQADENGFVEREFPWLSSS